jgi:glycosyltransferase involved in cell wall biosynthesis
MRKVSIITPTYNHAAYIGECILSVLAQTFEDWEMIIIDDGSSDKTGEVIAAFQDARIHYRLQVHAGINGLEKLYNDAFRQASGHFIAILEGDDFWPRDRLASLLAAFDRPRVVLSYGLTQLVDHTSAPQVETIPSSAHLKEHAASLSNSPPGVAVKAMLKGHALWTGAVSSLIRRDALDRLGGFLGTPGGALVDRPTFFALGMVGEFRFVPQVTGYWRRHPASGTSGVATWAVIARGLASYIEDFVSMHKEVLKLSDREAAHILSFWRSAGQSAQTAAGRACLIDGNYTAARALFQGNLWSVGGKHRGICWCGYIASYLHCDIEPLYRLFGRKNFRRSPDVRV